MKTNWISDASLRALGAARVDAVLLAGLWSVAIVPMGWAECQQLSIPARAVTSWTSSGFQNFISIDERRYPDTVAGRGPKLDPFGSERPVVSDNYFAFDVPPLTGTVVSASLKLHVRFLVSSRRSEVYEALSVTNMRVLRGFQSGGPLDIFESFDRTVSYGHGRVEVNNPDVSVPLNHELIGVAAAAGGRTMLMRGSLASLTDDPQLMQYLYVDSATLVLSYANGGQPQILAAPASLSLGAGEDATFQALACGAGPLSYQWHFNGALLAGQTNRDLFLKTVGVEQAGSYHVAIHNTLYAVVTAPAILTVTQGPPAFVIAPLDRLFLAGTANVQIYVRASGSPPPTYQWRRNGVALPGETNQVLRIPLITSDWAGAYTVVASNSQGSVTSGPGVVTVPPLTVNGPFDQRFLLGNMAVLGIGAYSLVSPVTYQWYKNSALIPGATNQLNAFVANPSEAADYFTIVSNSYGSVTSRVASVQVDSSPPEVYQVFIPSLLVAGTSNAFRVEAAAGPPPVYLWYHDEVPITGPMESQLILANITPADAGTYHVVVSNALGRAETPPTLVSVVPGELVVNSTFGSAFQVGSGMMLVANYHGVPEASFQWRRNGVPIAGETGLLLNVLHLTQAHNGEYSVSASNRFGTVVSAPLSVAVAMVPASVTLTPPPHTVREGDFYWLGGNVGGAPFPACQWQFGGVNIPGATNRILALSNVSTQHSGVYRLIVSNEFNASVGASVANYTLQVEPAGPLDHWSWVNPQPQANPLRAVVVGADRRVAVGDDGTVAVSTDGQTWMSRHLGNGIQLDSVAYGRNLFVAVGRARVDGLPILLSSPDGFTWTARSIEGMGALTGIVFANDLFVAVGATKVGSSSSPLPTPTVLVSGNGLSWDVVDLPGFGTFIKSVCYGNGLFVAAGAPGSHYSPSTYASVDGRQWVAGPMDSGGGAVSVAAGAGLFVAVTSGGYAGRSTDGLHWNWNDPVQIVPDLELRAITYGDGVFLAAGAGNRIFVSSEGLNWEARLTTFTHDVNGLAFGNEQFVAASGAGRLLVTTNAYVWTDQCIGNDGDLYALAIGSNGSVVVGDGVTLHSQDGAHWNLTDASRRLHSVTFANGLYVAGGRKGLIVTSPDGLAWTKRSVPYEGYIEHVMWGGGRFVAVGEDGFIATSPDAIQWTVLPTITPADLEDCIYADGLYMAVGGYFDEDGAVPVILTSTDGTTWKNRNPGLPFGVRARGVAYGKGQFVVVGNDGLVAVSTNTVAWGFHFLPISNLRSVLYHSGCYIAVGNSGAVASSPDGVNWTVDRCPADMNLHDVQSEEGTILVLGSNGAILRSAEVRTGLSLARELGGVRLHVVGGVAPVVEVEASTDLQYWTSLFWSSNATPATFFDTDSMTMPKRFYRTTPR